MNFATSLRTYLGSQQYRIFYSVSYDCFNHAFTYGITTLNSISDPVS